MVDRFNKNKLVYEFLVIAISLSPTQISAQMFPRNFNSQPPGFFGGNPNPFQQQPMFQNQGNPGNFGQPGNGGFGNPNFGGNFPPQNPFQNFGRPSGSNQFPLGNDPQYFNNGQPVRQNGYPMNNGQAFPPARNKQPAPNPQQGHGPGQPGFNHGYPSNIQNGPQPNQGRPEFNSGNPEPNQGQGRPEFNNGNPPNDQTSPQSNQFPNLQNPAVTHLNPEGRNPNNNNPNDQNLPNNGGQYQNRPSGPDYGWHDPSNGGNSQNQPANGNFGNPPYQRSQENMNKNNVGQNLGGPQQGPVNAANQANNQHNNFNNGQGPEISKPNIPRPDQHVRTTDPPIDIRHETEKNKAYEKKTTNIIGGDISSKNSGVKKHETKAWTYYDENNTENDSDLDLIELTKQGS